MAENSILNLTDRATATAQSALGSIANQQRAVDQQNRQISNARQGQRMGAIVGAGTMLAMGNVPGAAISLLGLL